MEAALVAANKVYEVQEDSLVPLPDSWGQMPKIEILSSDKVGFIICWCEVALGHQPHSVESVTYQNYKLT